MLIMPKPASSFTGAVIPDALWDEAETREMCETVGLYGKTFHFWRVERGDELPLGMPSLMMSFTAEGQVPWGKVEERDGRFGVDTRKKAELRRGRVPEMEPSHEEVDSCWK
jgi:hypothetical protein